MEFSTFKLRENNVEKDKKDVYVNNSLAHAFEAAGIKRSRPKRTPGKGKKHSKRQTPKTEK